jgi:hypothetical protein
MQVYKELLQEGILELDTLFSLLFTREYPTAEELFL